MLVVSWWVRSKADRISDYFAPLWHFFSLWSQVIVQEMVSRLAEGWPGKTLGIAPISLQTIKKVKVGAWRWKMRWQKGYFCTLTRQMKWASPSGCATLPTLCAAESAQEQVFWQRTKTSLCVCVWLSPPLVRLDAGVFQYAEWSVHWICWVQQYQTLPVNARDCGMTRITLTNERHFLTPSAGVNATMSSFRCRCRSSFTLLFPWASARTVTKHTQASEPQGNRRSSKYWRTT